MLDRFNEIYGVPKGTPFKRVELEDALIEKYHNLSYSKFGGLETGDNNIPIIYHVGVEMKWGLHEISTDMNFKGDNVTNALLALFIKYGVEPAENTEEYYKDNHCQEFQKIVKAVYKM